MKAHTIGAFDAKTHLSELLAKVGKGQSFVITKHGKPVAELGPVQKPDIRSLIGSHKGQIFMAADFEEPLEEFKEYMTVSSQGQVTLPPAFRTHMGLKEGDQLQATEINGQIVLKPTGGKSLESTFGALKKYSKPHKVDPKNAWAAGAAERDERSR